MKDLPKQNVYSGATPAEVAADLAQLVQFEDQGLPPAELQALLDERLLPHLMRYDLPGFQSMFNAFPPEEAQLGARLALATNQGVTNWQVSPGGATLEELCARALCRLFGLGEKAGATFMYSGTYGNQQALYMALHRHAERRGFDLAQKGIAGFANPEKLAVLVGQGAHFSLKHGVRMLGLGEDCLVQLPLDANWRIDRTALQAIVSDLRESREIVCLVATAGTTSTGAVDPINDMADLCSESGAWLHVDGAYGYAYKLVPEWAHLFAGDGRADSIVWDPHKQLGAPIPNSLLFVKDEAEFGRMALHSDYFNRPGESTPNPGLKSAPSTRPLSALPLVTLLRGRGIWQVVEDLWAPLAAMRALAKALVDLPGVELSHEPDTGILCFRITPVGVPEEQLDDLQRQLYERVMAAGRRSISITRLGGVNVLRLVVVKPGISAADLRGTVDELLVLAGEWGS